MSGTSATAGWTFPTTIGWGTACGSNATSVLLPASSPAAYPPGPSTAGTGQWSDVAPFFEAPESRVAGTASVTNNTAASSFATTQVLGTITCTQAAGEAIGESFLAFTTTKPAATSVATSNVLSGNTGMTVASHTGFPGSNGYYVQVDNEVMLVTGGAGTNIWTVTRAQNGSAQPATHLTNTGVTLGNVPGAGPSNPNSGDLFAHAGFVALTLNQNDSIAFTWQVNVTS